MLKPMRGCDVDLSKLRYPCYGSPKIDGIRGTNRIGHIWSRRGIPLPRTLVQRLFGHPVMSSFDGEIVSGAPNDQQTYERSYSAVMSKDSDLPVTFYVFDLIEQDTSPYSVRYEWLKKRVIAAQRILGPDRVVLVEQRLIHNEAELLAYEIECIENGYEGVMLRDPSKSYKYGKASMIGQQLMKLKRFVDSEAVIIGFVEQTTNENVRTTDIYGHAKRSTHKAGKRPTGRLGKFLVRDVHTGVEFKLSGKISKKQREEWWNIRESLLGKIVVYKHFAVTGVKNKPRLPIFKWFRDPMDFDIE